MLDLLTRVNQVGDRLILFVKALLHQGVMVRPLDRVPIVCDATLTLELVYYFSLPPWHELNRLRFFLSHIKISIGKLVHLRR